jgi:hypothetical protein
MTHMRARAGQQGRHLVEHKALRVTLGDEDEQAEWERERAADEAQREAQVCQHAGQAVGHGAIRRSHHAPPIQRAHWQQVERLHTPRTRARARMHAMRAAMPRGKGAPA